VDSGHRRRIGNDPSSYKHFSTRLGRYEFAERRILDWIDIQAVARHHSGRNLKAAKNDSLPRTRGRFRNSLDQWRTLCHGTESQARFVDSETLAPIVQDKWERLLQMAIDVKTLIKALAVLVAWLAWKHTASLTMCWFFWLTLLTVEFQIRSAKLGVILLVLGTASNAIVTLLNNGIMPVVGMPATTIAASPIWHTAASRSELPILADQASLWYFSFGDLCLISGALILMARFIQRKVFGMR
jgi:hypothetical protein